MSLAAAVADFIWPRYCPVCGRCSDRPARHLCAECVNRIPFLPTDGLCCRCGRDVPKLDGEFLCEDCRTNRPGYDRAGSAVRFEGEAREMVNAFKFRRRFDLREDLVDWLEAAVRSRFHVEEIDLVLPMPSSFRHRLLRGYNQCDSLAAGLARRLDKPCSGRAIRRVGRPKRQGGLDEKSRRENVKDTFRVRKPAMVSGRTVLVVDDIMTTGSTLSECAKELKLAGARTVWCQSIARSVRM